MNTKLLPHKWQKIGLIVFLVTLTITVVLLVLSLYTHEAPSVTILSRGISALWVVIMFLSFFCMIFSQEKVEDSRVQEYRLESIWLCAIISFCVTLMVGIIQIYLPEGPYESFRTWRMKNWGGGSTLSRFCLLYWIILKIKVRKHRRLLGSRFL